MQDYFGQIDRLKSSAISIAAITYGFGLVNWALHSWNNNLGLVSALDMQYFVAGVIPFLIFFLIYLTFKSQFSFLTTARRRIDRKSKGFYKFLRLVLITLSFLSLIVLFPTMAYHVFTANKNFAENLFIVIFSIFFLCALALPYDAFYYGKIERFQDRLSNYRAIKKVYSHLGQLVRYTSALFSILGVVLYAVYGYPEIPQELGGAKPKACYLEIRKGNLSDQMMNVLFTDTTKAIMRSGLIDLYFYSNDKILFKVHKSSNLNVYEIKRNDVALIEWN